MSVIVQSLFCDDIRQEANGKFILIGMYTGEMSIGSGPLAISLSIWVQMSGLSAGKHQLHFRARKHIGSQRTDIARVEAEIEVLENGIAVGMPLQNLPVTIDSDCSFSLSVSVDGSPEIPAGNLVVKANFADIASE